MTMKLENTDPESKLCFWNNQKLYRQRPKYSEHPSTCAQSLTSVVWIAKRPGLASPSARASKSTATQWEVNMTIRNVESCKRVIRHWTTLIGRNTYVVLRKFSFNDVEKDISTWRYAVMVFPSLEWTARERKAGFSKRSKYWTRAISSWGLQGQGIKGPQEYNDELFQIKFWRWSSPAVPWYLKGWNWKV